MNLRYGTVNEIKSGALDIGGTAGSFGWNLDYSKAKSNDVKVGSDSGFTDDTIPNSDLESENWSVRASWLGATGFFGGAYDEFSTNYGSAVESAVRIDMHQKRWDLRGGVNEPFGPFRLLKARLGGTDYDHVELEDGAVGTQFLNKSYEGRLELAHKQAGAWNGSFGIQSWHRDFEAIGDEAFVQPTTTFAGALFAFEEVGTGSLKGQFGLRYEGQSIESDDATLRDRDFSAPRLRPVSSGTMARTASLRRSPTRHACRRPRSFTPTVRTSRHSRSRSATTISTSRRASAWTSRYGKSPGASKAT